MMARLKQDNTLEIIASMTFGKGIHLGKRCFLGLLPIMILYPTLVGSSQAGLGGIIYSGEDFHPADETPLRAHRSTWNVLILSFLGAV